MRTPSATLPGTDDRPRLTVDLGAVRRNMRSLRAMRPEVSVMPVVKADCYGLGAQALVPVLAEEGAAGFIVSYRESGEEIAEAAGDLPVYILNARADSGGYTDRLRPVHSSAEAVVGSVTPCGLQVEGGMNRIGARFDTLADLPPQNHVHLVIMHMSHAGEPFATANSEQRRAFLEAKTMLRRTFPNAKFGHSASGGMLQGGHDEEDTVRPGVALYGAKAGLLGPLETCATFDALVLSVFDIAPGEKVGYGHLFTAERPTKLATLSVGYADGIPRSLLRQGEAVLNGRRCPYVGAVSMDLLTIDVTDAGEVTPGDRAELFGHSLPVDELAEKAGTIGYELLTGVGGRTQRRYVDSDKKRSTRS